MPFVAYYRVSTLQQGKSGLGLAAQQQLVKGFVKEEVVLGEFIEVESGKKAMRPQLRAAVQAGQEPRSYARHCEAGPPLAQRGLHCLADGVGGGVCGL